MPNGIETEESTWNTIGAVGKSFFRLFLGDTSPLDGKGQGAETLKAAVADFTRTDPVGQEIARIIEGGDMAKIAEAMALVEKARPDLMRELKRVHEKVKPAPTVIETTAEEKP